MLINVRFDLDALSFSEQRLVEAKAKVKAKVENLGGRGSTVSQA